MADGSLSWLNLFVSDMQTGFGPFVTVRLSAAGWNAAHIGTAMSVGTIAGLLAQVPAGVLCDATAAKRGVAAGAILTTMAAALLLAIFPGYVPVLLAEAMQGAAGVVLTLAIAGITLSLTQHDRLGERLGRNLRFAAIGGAVGAGLLGLAGTRISQASVFVLAAAFGVPALFALARIAPAGIAKTPPRTRHRTAMAAHRHTPLRSVREVLTDPSLLTLMACVVLFHLANAAMLPLAAGSLQRYHGGVADLVVSGAVIIAQLLTAAASPQVGRLAHSLGRRPVLLVGFALLPLRALMFAVDGSPAFILAAQVLDGLTGAAFGVLVPLIVADLTHQGGRFNLALGMVGLATSIGAAVSYTVAGLVADRLGTPVAFIYLAAMGVLAALLVGFALPETRPNA